MSLRQDQSDFAHAVALLILYAEQRGYEVTFGDAWARSIWPSLNRLELITQDILPGKIKVVDYVIKFLKLIRHSKKSWHYKRLALDLNLFRNGVWLQKTEDHQVLGEFWESIGGTWGGRFGGRDGNHYSWKEHGRKWKKFGDR